MSLYGSIDLHSNNSYVMISDEEDKVIKEKRLPNRLDEIDRFFREHKEELSDIVVESTFNGYWLLDGLKDLGYPTKLVHVAACKQYAGLKYTDDQSDCLWLNRMNRLGVIPEGYIYPREDRTIRDLLRKRMYLVQKRSGLVIALKQQFLSWNALAVTKDDLYELTPENLKALVVEEPLRCQMESYLEIIRVLNERIKIMESVIHQKAKQDEIVKKLRLLPGIGPILSWTIRYEVGEITRFKDSKNFLSYCGLAPRIKLSNFKKKGEGDPRNRNKYLRWAFAEVAIELLHKPKIKRFHDRLVKKKGVVKAKGIIASKIARIAFMVMTQVDFKFNENLIFN